MGISSAVNRAQLYSSRYDDAILQRPRIEAQSRRQVQDKKLAQQSKALGREITDFISQIAQDYSVTYYA